MTEKPYAGEDLPPERLHEHAAKAAEDAARWRETAPQLAELRRLDAERLRGIARKIEQAREQSDAMLHDCLTGRTDAR